LAGQKLKWRLNQVLVLSQIAKIQTLILVEEDVPVPAPALPHDSVEACSVVTFDIALISKWRPCPAKQSMHALKSHFGPRPQLVLLPVN
jgi:hypothetical protein